MLNKPKFMKPSANKEECTIDLSPDKEIPFSCIVDGNESIKAWQIVIYDIITNDIVFDSKRVDLNPSFYPVDEKNRNVVFSVDLSGYIKDNTTFKNRAEAYYWTITLWGSSENSVTSYQEVFYANKTPSIKFLCNESYIDSSAKTTVLNSKDCTFKAELDFGDNEDEYKAQLKRYGWRIIDSGNGQILVDTITKNQIYGSADNIICSYDGFLNGGNYSIELYIETQNNAKITSSFEFSVSYTTTFLSNDFKVETLKNEPAIMLDWNKALVISGILTDADEEKIVSVADTVFKTNYPVDKQCSIEIPDGFKVVYSSDSSLNFDIDESAYMVFSTQLLSADSAILFSAEGTEGNYEVFRQLSCGYDIDGGRALFYIVEGRGGVIRTASRIIDYEPSKYVWYNIFMSPLIEDKDGEYTVELQVYESRVVDCIYPSDGLYPMAEDAWRKAGSADFYPIFGNWTNLKNGG